MQECVHAAQVLHTHEEKSCAIPKRGQKYKHLCGLCPQSQFTARVGLCWATCVCVCVCTGTNASLLDRVTVIDLIEWMKELAHL